MTPHRHSYRRDPEEVRTIAEQARDSGFIARVLRLHKAGVSGCHLIRGRGHCRSNGDHHEAKRSHEQHSGHVALPRSLLRRSPLRATTTSETVMKTGKIAESRPA